MKKPPVMSLKVQGVNHEVNSCSREHYCHNKHGYHRANTGRNDEQECVKLSDDQRHNTSCISSQHSRK